MVARCMMAGNCGPDPETKQDQGGGSVASMSPPAIVARAFNGPEYEAEGAAARLAGKSRDDCPYDETAQALEWRSWVNGFGYAAAELMVLNDGRYFCSTDESPPSHFDVYGSSIPIRSAIEYGFWKPRFVTIATLDEIEKARAA